MEEKYQYYIKENKNAVDVRLVMPSVERSYFYGGGQGFEYPQIDESKCVRCYQCLKVCPFKEAQA